MSALKELERILNNATSFVSEIKPVMDRVGGVEGITEKLTDEELVLLHERLTCSEELFVDYLSRAKALCQSLWAKFDLNFVYAGISVLFIAITAVGMILVNRNVKLPVLMIVSLLSLVISSVVTSFNCEFVIIIITFFISGLILGVSVFLRRMIVKKTEENNGGFFRRLSADSILALALCVFQFAASFSNSFVVNEDKIVAFFIQALITVKCVQGLWKSGLWENRRLLQRQSLKKSGKREPRRPSVNGFLIRLSLTWITFEIITRTAEGLKGCREEQWYCVPSDFLKPLSALTEKNSAASNRFLLTVLCTGVVPLSVQQWLRYQGNLNGPSFLVLCVKYALPFSFFLMCAHWALQIVPQEMNSLLPEIQLWQQIILPQVVYCLCVVTLVCLLYSPLCIYTVFRGRKNSWRESIDSLQNVEDSSKIIHALFREIKQKMDDVDGKKHHVEDGTRDEESMPMVYGLATVYSSAVLVLSLAILLPLMMLLGNGMSLSLALMCTQILLLLEVHGLSQDLESQKSDGSISG